MVTIAHAAALTPEDVVPFEHSVALARASGAKLFSVHAKGAGDGDKRPLDASDVLTRWRADPKGIEYDAIMHECCDDPVNTILDALTKLELDLVIAGTHQREGLLRALVGSVAEAISHNVTVPTLLLPLGHPGFVSSGTGAIEINRILVPVGDEEGGLAALAAAERLVEMADVDDVDLVLLHVGDLDDAPEIEVSNKDRWASVRSFVAVGAKIEQAILSRAERASLVVMASRGHDSIGDVLLGSHTDRVLHRVKCPVLSVPV